RLRIVVQPPLTLPNTGNKQQDLAALVQMVNDQLESWIRQKPESWLWLHKRWPKSFYKKH
ncbi:MAG: lauroyl acyltransferase, partial [Acetobacter sp.]|nr:lauroyl acyltransferase [Acetobacter sp.]